MAAIKQNSLLGRNTWVGLIARIAVSLGLMGLSLIPALMLNASVVHEPQKMVMVAFLAMLFPIMAAVVLSEIPRGNDWLMMRVGLATFCRTGLPLLIVIYCSEIAALNLSEPAIGFLAYFYIFGLTMSVWMSINRVSNADLMSEAEHAVV